MIYGPKSDGTCVVEFKTAAGDALAINVSAGDALRGLPHSFREAGTPRSLIRNAAQPSEPSRKVILSSDEAASTKLSGLSGKRSAAPVVETAGADSEEHASSTATEAWSW